MFDLENGSEVPGQDGVEIALTRVLRLLRPGDVVRRTTYSPAHQHRLQQQGRFPRYLRFEGRACGLYEHELDAWFAVRMRARAEGLAPIGYRPALPQWELHLEDVPLVCGIALLRLRDVEALVGIKRTQIYRLIAAARFPAQVSLGESAARWVAHEVQEWLRDRCPPPGPPPGPPSGAVSVGTTSGSHARRLDLLSAPPLRGVKNGGNAVVPP